MRCTASEHRAVLGEGFHTVALPQMAERESVPGPYRDRKIEGRDHAHDAERMPLLVHAVLHPFRMHRQTVQHARLADGEIGNVDHLLDLAIALGLDLAVLHRYQAAERVLVAAQLIGHQANRLAALGRRHLAPALRRSDCGAENVFVVLGGCGAHARETLPGRAD